MYQEIRNFVAPVNACYRKPSKGKIYIYRYIKMHSHAMNKK